MLYWAPDVCIRTLTAGPKSKQLVRGFFNKSQKPKSIMKAVEPIGGPGSNSAPEKRRTSGHQQSIASESPAVIADVIERSIGFPEETEAKPRAENKVSERISSLSSTAISNSTASKPSTEQPEKVSRFKQQRAHLHGQLL